MEIDATGRRWDTLSAMYAPIAAGLLLAAATVTGQTPDGGQAPGPADKDPGLIISVESNLVVVPLHVYRKNNSVGGLGADAFELREDGVIQNIAFVEGPAGPGEDPDKGRTVSTEIILLVDVSHSVMKPGLLDIRTIRSAMLDGLREDVSISLYGFACTLKRFSGPTRDPVKLQAALEAAYAAEAGCSRVYEAIMQTVRDAANRGGNVSRMMVVFSDGFSTTNLSTDLVIQSANAFGIPIYPVILGHGQIVERAFRGGSAHRAQGNRNAGAQWQLREPSRNNPNVGNQRQSQARAQESIQREFADIGLQTGGRSYDLSVINNMVIRKILTSLATLAQTEYVVGYYPSITDEPLTSHTVEVRLKNHKAGKLYGGRRLIVH